MLCAIPLNLNTLQIDPGISRDYAKYIILREITSYLPMEKLSKSTGILLRVVLGWHFFYEGLTKLFGEGWSSERYLKGAYGFMSGFFHTLAGSEGILKTVDFLNVWGLILIGFALLTGIALRLASASGILLLLLYYFAYPPFGDTLFSGSEGNFWIVNRNLIEIAGLMVIMNFPAKEFSLQNLVSVLSKKRKKPTEDDPEQTDDTGIKRRELLKGLATLPVAGGILYAAASKASAGVLDGSTGATMTLEEYNLSDLKGVMPRGKLMDIEMSRLIMGCNLISGYAHSRDLHYVGSLFRHYNTEKKIYETFNLAEKTGINTTNMVLSNFPFFNRYKKITGSRMNTIAQVHVKPEDEDPLLQFKQARDYGTTTMYVQGGCADKLVRGKKLDWISKAVEFTREQGMPAGIGAHSIQVVLECEAAGIRPDYYFKTLHHDHYWSAHPREYRREFEVDAKRSTDHNEFHDNIFDIYPEQTVDVFRNLDIPLFGFKVLAGGAIKPQEGIRYAFEKGADFVCLGMFDFQIIEDVNITCEILQSGLKRERPWIA